MNPNDTTRPFLAGVVEGFYGRPWTCAQRRRLFDWLAAAGLNTYLYAPKDDLKHRALWREPYSPAEADALRTLVDECRTQGIEFVYALAPGLDMVCSSPAENATLRTKLTQARSLGVRLFAVLWDDIPTELGAADRARFGTAAAAQCAVTNAALAGLEVQARTTRLLFCPTVYCGRMAEHSVPSCAYLREIGEKLHPSIDVLWTGPQIVSEGIPVASVQEVAGVLRRKPVLWDNLHANDYDLRRLYLGPYAGRAPELRSELAGVLLNPNCQFEANFVPVHALGQYLRPGAPPSPSEAHTRAIDAWLPSFKPSGRAALTRDELALLCDLLYLPAGFGPEAQRYLDAVARLLDTPPEGWGEAAVRFETVSRRIVSAFDRLTEVQDRELVHALYPHAWEVKETALLLLAWVEWRRNNPGADRRFQAPDFRPGVFRGGFAATVERLLPMDDAGRFQPAASTASARHPANLSAS